LRPSGYFCKFDANRCIILGVGLKFLGTRIYGPITHEFRSQVYRYKGARFYYKMLAFSCITI
jgi:ribosomal protein L14